jgi:protein SCO1/2
MSTIHARIRRVPALKGAVAAAAFAAGALLASLPAAAQYRQDPPATGPSVPVAAPEIVEKKNAAIPQDLVFTSSDGKKVKLGDLFDAKRPVILQLVYFSCPNLCGFSQDELVKTLRSGPRGLSMGQDYNVVVVSIDPEDTPTLAAAKRQKYAELMGLAPDAAGFTYLTGDEESIKQLSDAVGFPYKRNYGPDVATVGKFAHSTGIFVCTPYGHLSQTITGLTYTADAVHNSLLVAGQGKVGAALLGVGLSCGAVHFNPSTGQYEQNPWFWVGSAVGGASFAFMGLFLGSLWLGELKKKKQDKDKPGAGMTPGLT